MESRGARFGVAVVVVLSIVGLGSMLLLSAAAAATSGPFIRAYGRTDTKPMYADVTPEDVQSTSDGGKIVLALTQSSTGFGVSWLIKLDSSGTPQWQREVGCLSGAPGDYADGVSVQQTTDGGYIIGGGTVDCGSKSSCPALSGRQCALVERLDADGKLVWARVYSPETASAITQIHQTTDGGFIAVGSATPSSGYPGALIIKLSAAGAVQWQREIGPDGAKWAVFNAVQQTDDGGYVATGEFVARPGRGVPMTSVLAVKFDSVGNVVWQHGFNHLDGEGSPNATASAFAVIDSSGGGYLVAGHLATGHSQGQCCDEGLLLKLDSAGDIQWQKGYSGGVYDGDLVGPVIYSVRAAADGGYFLSGDDGLVLSDSVQIEPWLAKVDLSGNLVWQHFYYRTDPTSGRPIAGYMPAEAPSAGGGLFGLGFTEDFQNPRAELLGVATDSAGNVPGCSEVHPATALIALDPRLTGFAPSLSTHTVTSPNSASPATTASTPIAVQKDC